MIAVTIVILVSAAGYFYNRRAQYLRLCRSFRIGAGVGSKVKFIFDNLTFSGTIVRTFSDGSLFVKSDRSNVIYFLKSRSRIFPPK